MEKLLKGAPVAAALNEKTAADAVALRERGIVPLLAILRVGERPDDLAYERGAMKRCAGVGIETRSVVLPADVSQDTLLAELDALNRDDAVHGILLFLPLPKHLDGEAVRCALCPEKDVDGITDGSLAGVFTGAGTGFPPCTAQASMEILDYYGIDCAGKRAAVIGRSLVIGRPAAMLLMQKNATVTICHSKTADLPAAAREAEILLVAAGQMEHFGSEYLRPGQVVVDVGIGWNEEKGKLCGDVRFDEAVEIVEAITPVPGGVGAVTTAVLARHVVEAADRCI
ncbi:MAG: tetrahydrofolate dehydrogenase/cyclohydrolase catalytic domain-containing protein [Eubacteriales bacterium]|nr:tetrahydrofolate dehydrogenase/cyclohydrolase catalytic domain-containing protein [Eubacteriales bacterium]